ncbi:MAG: asparagine synthase (glutamine-hydrolyzing) [Phycisphaerales bacterium]|nr:asparagine synthase (glutamine-hydrolyzing) [Phycisphaerales bacterium]
MAGAIGCITPEVIGAVHRMNDAQIHRGPDDQGCWRSGESVGDAGAAFAFRRLSIIDLTADGHQPMIDPETGNVIVFNGEIYNYQELRRELAHTGVVFKSRSDTEVILKSYAKWGAAAINRLRGMFAFALWDAHERRVLLARDRLGIKPLYLCNLKQPNGKRTLLFASELRSLLASDLIDRKLSRTGLSTYMWNGFVVGPQTIVEAIELLPAGTLALVDPNGGSYCLERYWQVPTASHAADADDSVECLRHELTRAIRQHLISDVPLGVFLSGGVDSSAIAALAVRVAGSNIRTFNISFNEAQYDESRYASAVANSLGTDHVEVKLNQGLFSDRLDDALASIDQPTFDAINTYFISRAVREAGITVALAGTGGDELFGGYRSFVDVPRAARWSRRLSFMPEPALRFLAAQVCRVKFGAGQAVPSQTRWGKLGDAIAAGGRIVDAYQTSYGLFTSDFIDQIMTAGSNGHTHYGLTPARSQELAELATCDGDLAAVSALELSCYVGERLLRDTDAASMAVSLEARVPLLDHQVVEAAASLDPQRRFQPLGEKAVLRELALDRLNPALFNRPKSGFVLPIDRWCREQLRDQVAQTLGDTQQCAAAGLNAKTVGRLWQAFQAGAPGIYWSRIWAIFALLWWCRRHGVSL